MFSDINRVLVVPYCIRDPAALLQGSDTPRPRGCVSALRARLSLDCYMPTLGTLALERRSRANDREAWHVTCIRRVACAFLGSSPASLSVRSPRAPARRPAKSRMRSASNAAMTQSCAVWIVRSAPTRAWKKTRLMSPTKSSRRLGGVADLALKLIEAGRQVEQRFSAVAFERRSVHHGESLGGEHKRAPWPRREAPCPR